MAKILCKAVQQNLTAKLYSKATLILNAQNKLQLYNKTLLQRITVKVWRNGLLYLILPAGGVVSIRGTED